MAPEGLGDLVRALADGGYQVIGPTLRDGAICFAPIDDASGLPWGVMDRQDRGSYHTVRRETAGAFSYSATALPIKQLFMPPARPMVTARRTGHEVTLEPCLEETPALAIIGLRACDLAGLDRLDHVLLDGPVVDPGYAGRRRTALLVAVNCSRSSPTCFCSSTGTGPGAEWGYDLCLTESQEPAHPGFVVECAGERGAAVLAKLDTGPVPAELADLPARVAEEVAARIQSHVDLDRCRAALANGFEHRQWDDVAARCLTCGNCTSVCPTCFCADIIDASDLTGACASRTRIWDSCFTLGFTYVGGGSARPSALARYRQWLSHKFLYWQDQFGECGCVGCGRCAVWCPVGIDLIDELHAIAGGRSAPAEVPNERA